jgi:hypothetical protein
MVRLASPWSVILIWLSGCGGGSAFDPAAVDLVGQWTFNSTSNEPGTVCHITNLPVDIQAPLTSGAQFGLVGTGGMIQCTTGGQPSPARPYLEGSGLELFRSGDEIRFRLGGYLFYQGRIESVNRMSGAVTFDSVPGSWVGERH